MMELHELLAKERSPKDIIRDIKAMKASLGIPKWEEVKKEYYPELHRIKIDQEFWKDKGSKRKPRKVSRITYALQKIATRRMTQMAFALPVKRVYAYNNESAKHKEIIESIEKIYERIHIDSINRKRMPMFFASCELLTIWYAVDTGGEEHHDYGFPTKYKLRCKSYSEMNGYTLYPIFDDYDDLLGMCIEYRNDEVVDGARKEVYNFEIFTKDRHLHYKGALDTIEPEPFKDERIKIGKLPLAYMYRHMPIWEDQTNNCDEIELAYSRQSEILRHNSAPYLKVSGQMSTAKGKAANPNDSSDDIDDARRIIRVDNGGDLSYVTWDQSVEAVKFFVSDIKENSEEQLQLPNLSMTKMADLGGIGYDARKTVLTDAHLKVGDESGELIMFLEREWKVIVAFIGFMNPSWKSDLSQISCEHIITPFIQNDEKEDIEKWTLASGEPLISERTALARSGMVEDVDKELELKKAEAQEKAERNRIVDVFQAGI